MGKSTALVERQVHRQATAAPVSEIAGTLQELLSRRLTAFIAGVGDGKTVSRWASGEVAEIRDVWMEQRLRTAYEITQLLLTYDAAQTVNGLVHRPQPAARRCLPGGSAPRGPAKGRTLRRRAGSPPSAQPCTGALQCARLAESPLCRHPTSSPSGIRARTTGYFRGAGAHCNAPSFA